MTMLAEIGEDARFFALLLEALERALKVLVVMDYDFRQILLPPLVAFARRIWDRPINVPGLRGVVKLRKPRSDMKLSRSNRRNRLEADLRVSLHDIRNSPMDATQKY